jgi:hypothetical protein
MPWNKVPNSVTNPCISAIKIFDNEFIQPIVDVDSGSL